MPLVDDFLCCRLPSELIMHILRCLDCWDLVAMCKANPEWEALIESEALWRKASQHRWPHIAGGTQPPMPGEPGDDVVFITGPGPSPLAGPVWVRALGGSARWSLPSDHGTSRVQLPQPPPPSAPGAAWCRFYLTHDAFEVMNLVTLPEYHEARRARLHTLEHAMRWCCEYVHIAALMTEQASSALCSFTELHELTIASTQESSDMVARTIASNRQLHSLALIDSLPGEDDVEAIFGSLATSGCELRTLRICHSQLQPEGGMRLVRALDTTRTLHWLESLALVGCAMGDAPCVQLCGALLQQRSLQCLDLSSNRLTKVAVATGLALLLRDSEGSPPPAAEVPPPAFGSRAASASAAATQPTPQHALPAASGHAHPQPQPMQPRALLHREEAGAQSLEGSEGAGSAHPSRSDLLCLAPPAVPLLLPADSTPGLAAAALAQASAGAEMPAKANGARPAYACRLTKLVLSLNPLGADGTEALAVLLRDCQTLEHLSLQYVTLYSREPANLLGCLLGAELRLISLDLSCNYISACGSPVEQITAQLGANSSLRELRLRRCCIGGWRRARALARGLLANSTLTSIDLSYNGLGAAQAAQSSAATLSLAVGTLCHAFSKNCALRSIDLSHNALGDAGCAALVQAIADAQSVTMLDLHSNQLSVQGMRAIAAQLQQGGHSWLPLALHTHSRHVRLAHTNLVARAQPATPGGVALLALDSEATRALSCAQPFCASTGLLYPWPLDDALGGTPEWGAAAIAREGCEAAAAQAEWHRGESWGTRGSVRAPRAQLCVDMQGNIAISQLLAHQEAGSTHAVPSPWEQAAKAAATRAGWARGSALVGCRAEEAEAEAAEAEAAEAEAAEGAEVMGDAAANQASSPPQAQQHVPAHSPRDCVRCAEAASAAAAGRGKIATPQPLPELHQCARLGASREHALSLAALLDRTAQFLDTLTFGRFATCASDKARFAELAQLDKGFRELGGRSVNLAGLLRLDLAHEQDVQRLQRVLKALSERIASRATQSAQTHAMLLELRALPVLDQGEGSAFDTHQPLPPSLPLPLSLGQAKRKERGWDGHDGSCFPAVPTAGGGSAQPRGGPEAQGGDEAQPALAQDADESQPLGTCAEAGRLRPEEAAMSSMALQDPPPGPSAQPQGLVHASLLGGGPARARLAEAAAAKGPEGSPPQLPAAGVAALSSASHELGSASVQQLLPSLPALPLRRPDSDGAQRPVFAMRSLQRSLAHVPAGALRELSQLEASTQPNPYHMGRQKHIKMGMRRILIDWLIELFEELQLPPHTLMAGVHAVDRYLSVVTVQKECLQLVGAVSLMLCSNNYCKLLSQDGDAAELRGLATAEDVVYWTDNTYNVEEVTEMEASLMHRLGLGLCSAVFAHRCPLGYLTKSAALMPLTDDIASVAHEILLRSTREYNLLRFEPSLLAATALVIAVRSCQQRASPQLPNDGLPDERTLYACLGHSAAEVRQCESIFGMTRVIDSPLACHSIASGLLRTPTSKTILVHLDIRCDPDSGAAPFDPAAAALAQEGHLEA